MATDILIDILEDGTASIKVGAVADTVHLAADQMLEELQDMLGGTVVKEENPDNPGLKFWKNKRVLRGGNIVQAK